MMTRKVRKITFTLSNGEWEAGGKPAKELKSDFERDSGEYEVEMLAGTPTGRYEFTQDPIWIRKVTGDADTECPTSFGHGDVFSYTTHGPAKLILLNLNNEENPTEYRYQLNVMDKKTGEYVPIDPILSNGGRGGR